jgi:hypothetical protein
MSKKEVQDITALAFSGNTGGAGCLRKQGDRPPEPDQPLSARGSSPPLPKTKAPAETGTCGVRISRMSLGTTKG